MKRFLWAVVWVIPACVAGHARADGMLCAARSVLSRIDVGGATASSAVSGDYLFIARYQDGVSIYNISDPSSPLPVGSIPISEALCIAIEGSTAFIGGIPNAVLAYDISDPASPALLGSYDAGDTVRHIALRGDIAAISIEDFGVEVLSVSDPSSITRLGAFPTSDLARSTAIVNETLYVAERSEGLVVISLADPTQPVVLGSLASHGSPHDIAVVGETAYIANRGDGLWMVDVSDPRHPTTIARWRTDLEFTTGIEIANGLAYVADFNVGFVVVNISNPAFPYTADTKRTVGNGADVHLAGDLAIYTTQSEGVWVVDAQALSGSPARGFYRFDFFAGPGVAKADLAYVGHDRGVSVFDISAAFSPVEVGFAPVDATTFSPLDVKLVDSTLFVVDAQWGLRVFDVSDPMAPVEIADRLDTTIDAIDVVGPIAYLARRGGVGSIQTLDMTDPQSPMVIGMYEDMFDGMDPTDVQVVGEFAYVASWNRLRVFDVSEPATPTPIGVFEAPDDVNALFVVGDVAYLAADYIGGLQIVDVSDPTQPVFLASIQTAAEPEDVVVRDGIAYIADGDDGILLIDVSIPAAPRRIGWYVRSDSRYVFVHGDRAYLSSGRNLQVVDISDCPPCLADLDTSGVLNFNDIDLFAASFVAGDLAVDLDGDGVLSFHDLDAFAAAFLAGCG